MLRQVLGLYDSELSRSTIERLRSQKVPESQRLDYKEKAPENKEFSKIVAVMANGGGGVIVLGVKDENARPVGITPVPLGEEIVLRASLVSRGPTGLLFDDQWGDRTFLTLQYYKQGIGIAESLDVFADLEVDVDVLAPGPAMTLTAKMLLDDIVTAFGWPECHQIGGDGELRERYFGEQWKRALSGWTERYGIQWASRSLDDAEGESRRRRGHVPWRRPRLHTEEGAHEPSAMTGERVLN